MISTFSPFNCPIWPVLKLGKSEWCLRADARNLSAVARQPATQLEA